MEKSFFIDRSGVSEAVENYEPPIIIIEEIVVEHGFAGSGPLDPGNPPTEVW